MVEAGLEGSAPEFPFGSIVVLGCEMIEDCYSFFETSFIGFVLGFPADSYKEGHCN